MHHALLLFVLVLLLGATASAHGDEVTAKDRFRPYAQFLADVGDRPRRIIYTPYPVSAHRGVVQAFVHVSDGTVVLSRTDLVVDAPFPIVLRRAYHSARSRSADLGSSGWHFTLCETIERASGGGFTYRYGNGATLRFLANGALASRLDANLTDVLSLREVPASHLEVLTRTGLTKTFVLVAGRFRLVSVKDAYGNAMNLEYSPDGLLRHVGNSSGVWLELVRDERGRVIRARDARGRSVEYGYAASGVLARVVDAGGHEWQYAYDHAGRLASTRTPNGVEDLAWTYDGAGRAVQSRANGQPYAYVYEGARTDVRDPEGRSTRFWSAPSGITVAVETAVARTELALDSDGLPAKLFRNGTLVAQLQGDGEQRAFLTASDGTAYRMRFDAIGRLWSVSSDAHGGLYDVEGYGPALIPAGLRYADQTLEGVIFDARGEIASFRRRDGSILGFDRIGAFWRIRNSQGAEAELLFDPIGRLSTATAANGRRLFFGYNDTGLREQVTSSDGSRVRYQYDASGNLFHSQVSTTDASRPGFSYVLGEGQRVDSVVSSEGTRTAFEYSKAGKLIGVRPPAGARLQFQYDDLQRLKRVTQGYGAPIEYDYSSNEPDIVAQLTRRALPVYNQQREPNDFGSRFETLQTRIRASNLGWFTFDETLRELAFAADVTQWSPLSVVTRSVDSWRVEALLGSDTRAINAFAMPANRLSVPPEYWSVNCCICLCQDPAYECAIP